MSTAKVGIRSLRGRYLSSLVKSMVVPLAFLVCCTLLIAAFDLDRQVSGLCYQGNVWIGRSSELCRVVYEFGELPGIMLGIAGCTAAAIGIFWRQMRKWQKPGIFLGLTLVLGPGLVVNAILKPYWSRPRPVDVEAFGGEAEFVRVWGFVPISSDWKSFPCGHASIAFYLMAPAFIFYRKRFCLSVLLFVLGVGFGCIVGYVRIAQGCHFLSDVLWAGGIVYLVCLLSSRLFHFTEPANEVEGDQRNSAAVEYRATRPGSWSRLRDLLPVMRST